MTVRIEHVTRAWATHVYIRPGKGELDILHSEAFERYILAMVRGILRERSDSTKIPVVMAAVAGPVPNEYGHNMFVDVEYDHDGHRATYAATITRDGLENVTCYMD